MSGPLRLSVSVDAALLAAKGLTPACKLLWSFLDARALPTPPAMSQAEIAAALGMNEHTVRRGIGRLERSGMVAVLSRSGAKGRHQYFTLRPWEAVPGLEYLDPPHQRLWDELRNFIRTGK